MIDRYKARQCHKICNHIYFRENCLSSIKFYIWQFLFAMPSSSMFMAWSILASVMDTPFPRNLKIAGSNTLQHSWAHLR